jgi:dienelactone hydrolase
MMPPSSGGAFVRGDEPTAQSASSAGPYEVGEIADGFRDGPDFGGATIYYPVDAEPPFAMIVFCPGWLGTQASDRAWAPFMASHGIVFMNIDTNATGDSVRQREAAELDALVSLQAEHTREGSPLKGKLALERVSFMGWSMGGGGAWLNAQADPKIKAIVTLAGHHATAGGAEIARGITVPTFMLAGTADTSVLGLGMSQPVYEVIPESTPKMLYEVEGATHFDFNDPAYLDGAPARYALSWEKVYLEGDMRYYKFLLEQGPQSSDFRTNLE